MGVDATEKNFYSSTLYAIDYLKKYHPEIRKIFLLGMAGIVPEFEGAGFQVVDEAPDAVILAFDRSLVYDRLCKASWYISKGVPGFATHPDVFCPTDQPTFLVDCGAITKCVETATGKTVKVLGKPDPGMLLAGAARCNVQASEVMMIGDRLSTDIAVGCNAGAWTCHISTQNDYSGVPEKMRPSITCRDLAELQKYWEKSSV